MQYNAPLIVDDFLDQHELTAVMDSAANVVFEDWTGPDGQTYRRIARAHLPEIQAKIEKTMGPVDMHGMAFRLNFGGERPNAAIHSDLGWGTHAMVLYLRGGGTGTAFWRHRATGATQIREGDADLLEVVKADWDNADAWEMTARVSARPGRAVIYDSSNFHSRWPFAAAGAGPEDGRLIVVAFFTPHPLRKFTVVPATAADKPEIMRMARTFYATTTYAHFAPLCEATCDAMADDLLDRGLLVVARHGGRAIGMVGCYLAPFLFNRDEMAAHEVFWWVDEDWRAMDVGKLMLESIEREARDRGAGLIQMLTLSTSPPHAAKAYVRAGYSHSETCFTKILEA